MNQQNTLESLTSVIRPAGSLDGEEREDQHLVSPEVGAAIPNMGIPMAVYPAPVRAESIAGFWLTGDAAWWSVMDDFGTCEEVDVRLLDAWLSSGKVVS